MQIEDDALERHILQYRKEKDPRGLVSRYVDQKTNLSESPSEKIEDVIVIVYYKQF